MTNFNLNLSSAIEIRSKSITFEPTTTTPFVTPVFEGTDIATGPYTQQNNVFPGLGSSVDIETPNRPGGGQLYPRGNQ
jgi:hypothetical protein